MLEFKNVSFDYLGYDAHMLKDLSFSVNNGEFVSIIGASGCGKSTIFRLINGLEKQNGGEILINGENISKLKNYSAYMPQKDLLMPWRTIEKNLALPLEIQGIEKHQIAKKCADILCEIGLYDYKDKYPKELSGGMKQRISFARTLLTGSDLLLLDEPFSALDSLTRITLQQWLLEQWERHSKTIVFITHDVEEAILLSKKIFIINNRPIEKMEIIDVPLDYPRDRGSLLREDIVLLKEKLIEKLRQKVAL